MQARVADLTGLVGSARLDPGRRGLLAVAAVAVVVAVAVGGWVLTSRPHQIPVSAAGSTPLSDASLPAGGSLQSPLATASSTAGAASQIVVDVVGKVRHPGVVRLASGARVSDAVTAAGGMQPGVDPVTVNLARKLVDGEQIVIGVSPPAGADAGSSDAGASGSGPTGLVDLNTATADQLDALPGVGPVLAQHIIDWRTAQGRFDSVDQLNDVSGIGAAKFADLKPLVTV